METSQKLEQDVKPEFELIQKEMETGGFIACPLGIVCAVLMPPSRTGMKLVLDLTGVFTANNLDAFCNLPTNGLVDFDNGVARQLRRDEIALVASLVRKIDWAEKVSEAPQLEKGQTSNVTLH